MKLELNVEELKVYLKKVIVNNKRLEQETNRKSIPISIRGGAGIAKTSAVKDLQRESITLKVKNKEGEVKELKKSVKVVTINAANISEEGDLLGYPITEFKIEREGKTLWVPESEISNGKYLGENRMGYAIPKWLQEGQSSDAEYKILLVDDYTRA